MFERVLNKPLQPQINMENRKTVLYSSLPHPPAQQHWHSNQKITVRSSSSHIISGETGALYCWCLNSNFLPLTHVLLRLQIFFIKHDFRNQPLWRTELSHVDIEYIRLHSTIFQSNKKSRHPDKFRTLTDPKYLSEIRWHKSHGGVLKFKTLAFQSNRGREHKLTTI